MLARDVATCSGPLGATRQHGRCTLSSFTTGLPTIRLVLQLASQRCCNRFWYIWSNSPAWEVDLLKLYNRLAFHQVTIATCLPEMLQHVLAHLKQLASLGGGPAQALQQACLPSGMYRSLPARDVATWSGPPGATHQLRRWTFSSFTTGLPSIRYVSQLACQRCCNMFWSTWSNSSA